MEPIVNDEGDIEELYSYLRRFENLDLRDALDQQGELTYRLDVVRALHGEFQNRHNPRDLFTAIDHAEVIIKRLPASLADKIETLNRLSWMKMSTFFPWRHS